MKKFLAMVLALIMALSLVACGEQGDGQKGDDSAFRRQGRQDRRVRAPVRRQRRRRQAGDPGYAVCQQDDPHRRPSAARTYKVELVYADNASSNDKAPTAAQTLVAQGVSAGAGLLRLRRVHRCRRYLFGEAQVSRHRRDLHQPPGDCRQRLRTSASASWIRSRAPFWPTLPRMKLQATKAYCLAKQGDDYSGGLANYFIKAFGEENCVYEHVPRGQHSDFYHLYDQRQERRAATCSSPPCPPEAAAQIIAKAETQRSGHAHPGRRHLGLQRGAGGR